MAVRFLRIQLRPAHYLGDKEPLDLWLVHAVEENPPADTKAAEWFLLTTIEITLAADAEQCLRRAIAINLVIAWRIMLMTLLGREVPELPAEVLFSDMELRTLQAYAKKKYETAHVTW
jgi:hypothetical protein